MCWYSRHKPHLENGRYVPANFSFMMWSSSYLIGGKSVRQVSNDTWLQLFLMTGIPGTNIEATLAARRLLWEFNHWQQVIFDHLLFFTTLTPLVKPLVPNKWKCMGDCKRIEMCFCNSIWLTWKTSMTYRTLWYRVFCHLLQTNLDSDFRPKHGRRNGFQILVRKAMPVISFTCTNVY
jgi:hypothetical protein